jgi:hypothetical protein
MNKNNSEHRVMGYIMFNGVLYEIVEYAREYIIRLGNLGIKIEKLSTEIYYSDLYELNNEDLILESIRIENCYGTFHVIKGIKPMSSGGTIIYKMLRIPVDYTGRIIVKRGKTGSEKSYRITLNK